MMKNIKISDDTYKKVKEIAKAQSRTMQAVFNKALENYHKITIGNKLNTKD